MVKRDSSLQSPMAVSFTPLQSTLGIVHGDLRLVCGCSAMAINFMKLQTNSYCADIASRVLLVIAATEDRPFLCVTRLSNRRSRSVSLCGLPLHGWAVVAPIRFHFTITELSVDWGSSSRAEIWLTYLLERWYPMMMPHWKSLSSSVSSYYCQCLSMEIAWLCARFYTPVSNGCGWNSRIHSFEGVFTYYCNSVLLSPIGAKSDAVYEWRRLVCAVRLAWWSV